MLTDPRDALGDQGSFVNALVGMAGLARAVRALASRPTRPADPPAVADDFVHLLLGIVGLAETVERLGGPKQPEARPTDRPALPGTPREWLR